MSGGEVTSTIAWRWAVDAGKARDLTPSRHPWHWRRVGGPWTGPAGKNGVESVHFPTGEVVQRRPHCVLRRPTRPLPWSRRARRTPPWRLAGVANGPRFRALFGDDHRPPAMPAENRSSSTAR